MTVIGDQPRQLGHRDAMDFLAIQFIVGVVQQSIPRAPLQQRYIVFYLDCRAMLDDFLFLIHTISPDQVYSWGIYRHGRRKEIKISSTLEKPHSIAFRGRRIASDGECRSRLDFPLIPDVQSSYPSQNNVNNIKALEFYHEIRWSLEFSTEYLFWPGLRWRRDDAAAFNRTRCSRGAGSAH